MEWISIVNTTFRKAFLPRNSIQTLNGVNEIGVFKMKWDLLNLVQDPHFIPTKFIPKL